MLKNKKISFSILAVIILSGLLILFKPIIFQKTYSFDACQASCKNQGFPHGSCLWREEAAPEKTRIGHCVIPEAKHCAKKGMCGCYCAQ